MDVTNILYSEDSCSSGIADFTPKTRRSVSRRHCSYPHFLLASDTRRKPQDKAKPSGYTTKKSKHSSSSDLQHNETLGANIIFQNVGSVDNTLNETFNGHGPAPVKVPGKESKRRKVSGMKDEAHASGMKANGTEHECPQKKARPDQQSASTIQVGSIEPYVILNATMEVIPDAAIKPNNANKRNNSTLDPIAIDEKVRDFHSKDKLRSLTVPELKCFLSAKKAKVGGKKEELIQRIVDLLFK